MSWEDKADIVLLSAIAVMVTIAVVAALVGG